MATGKSVESVEPAMTARWCWSTATRSSDSWPDPPMKVEKTTVPAGLYFVTVASSVPFRVAWNAPGVVGKSVEKESVAA